MNTTPDLLAAIGRFHPLILHFPIGLIAGVVGLELWNALRPSREVRGAASVLLVLACVSAVAAAACGLLLAQTGGYEGSLLDRHRLFGLGTAVLASLALLLHSLSRRAGGGARAVLYRLTLAAAVAAMVGAGYSGGIVAHGADTPVGALVAALRATLGDAAPGGAASASPAGEDGAAQASAQAILEAHCYECHGEAKQKSRLRLDSRDAALAGGKSGKPAIVPGNAMESHLVEAITLPGGNKHAMPPTGKPRLKPAEVVALIDWINRGAMWPDKNQLAPPGLAAPAAALLDELRAEGFRVSQLAQGHPLIRVDAVPDGAQLARLAAVAKQVAWLNLAGRHFEPGALRVLADMPYLTRLELQHSDVRDADLADVAKVPRLGVLNLYATQVGDAGLEHLGAAATLERLYLWETQVTPAGVQRLREALPEARIDTGDAGGDSAPGAALAPATRRFDFAARPRVSSPLYSSRS